MCNTATTEPYARTVGPEPVLTIITAITTKECLHWARLDNLTVPQPTPHSVSLKEIMPHFIGEQTDASEAKGG